MRVPGRDESPLRIDRKRDLSVSCGPGMPGPYRVAGRFTARIVGGGVLDAPQGSSLSRVTCRAASPLAAVAVCGGGKVPSRDCRPPLPHLDKHFKKELLL